MVLVLKILPLFLFFTDVISLHVNFLNVRVCVLYYAHIKYYLIIKEIVTVTIVLKNLMFFSQRTVMFMFTSFTSATAAQSK